MTEQAITILIVEDEQIVAVAIAVSIAVSALSQAVHQWIGHP